MAETVWVFAAASNNPAVDDPEYGLAVSFSSEPTTVDLIQTLPWLSRALREYEAERGWPRGVDEFSLQEVPVEESEDATA